MRLIPDSTRVAAIGLAAVAGLSLAAGCNTQRQGSGTDRAPTRMMITSASMVDTGGGIQPGIHPAVVYGSLKNPYHGNVQAATDGRRLFVAYNCSGCHGGHAGGGMGPSLRDSLWLYGSSDTQIFATIVEGRPAGMPAWGPKIPEDQIWKLVTYINTLNTPSEPDQVSPQPHEVKPEPSNEAAQ